MSPNDSGLPPAASPAPAVVRPAATVVVLRDGARPFEVLMVRRTDKVAFMAGAYVFPGGRADDSDAVSQPGDAAGILEETPLRFGDVDPARDRMFRRAAVREIEEEASVRVSPASLEPLAHWVTPDIEIRRYDTRFFLARMPGGQVARHDGSETTALEWVAPDDALQRCLRGDILLPPPTWTTLRRLSRRGSIDDAFAWAGSRPIVRVQPGFHRDDSMTMLTLPGDPLFPTLPGWEVPEETRFVLGEGNRWLPLKP